MEKLIEVSDLEIDFTTQSQTVYAVNGVSFHVKSGETLGIVGESGSGKSVSAMSILRLIPEPPGKIRNGKVMFEGRDLLKIPKEELRKIRGNDIAIIYQDPMTTFNPVLKIGKQLSESMMIHKGLSYDEARKNSIDLLGKVGIPAAGERIDDYPHQFSGGMCQRAMIAMALSCNPKLLIADEPTTALDVTIQAQIINLIKKLRDEYNMSIIWISHDLGVIAGIADRIAVMYSGLIVEETSARKLYHNPLHPYTKGLLLSLIRGDDEGVKMPLYSIKGIPPILTSKPTQCPFSPRCSYRINKCTEENPRLLQVEEGRRVACWCWEQVKSEKVEYEKA